MNGGEVSGDKLQRAYRIRIAFFLVCVMAVVAVLATTCQGVRALMQLNVVERERDQWQRSSDILQSLNVGLGKVVADLGCGSGYFTLKLSSIVGPNGRVLAIDIRRTPLFFLWLRAILRHHRNIIVIHGRPDNPKLPAGGVDAVLIVSTYHELANPEAVLHRTYESLRPGGRLVVVDRGADSAQGKVGVPRHAGVGFGCGCKEDPPERFRDHYSTGAFH
jgi:ubiquinone/menaquinone biosynthesis C-methylase UbiE